MSTNTSTNDELLLPGSLIASKKALQPSVHNQEKKKQAKGNGNGKGRERKGKKRKKKSQTFTSVRHASLVAAQERLNVAMLNTSCKVSVNCHVQ